MGEWLTPDQAKYELSKNMRRDRDEVPDTVYGINLNDRNILTFRRLLLETIAQE